MAAFEGQMASFGPAWLAYEMRLTMAGIQKFGMQSAQAAVERLQAKSIHLAYELVLTISAPPHWRYNASPEHSTGVC